MPQLKHAFIANAAFNGVILFVLAVGIAVNLRQVWRLQREVLWIEEFQQADGGPTATGLKPVLLAPMLDTDSIEGKRVLVVDDVVDSGRTLALVLDLLTNVGAQPRSAVVYAKPTTVVEPDYVWARTDKWIVFPWSSRPGLDSALHRQRSVWQVHRLEVA